MPSATHLSTGTSLTAAAPSRMTSSPSEGLRAGETHDRPKPLVAAWGQLQDPPATLCWVAAPSACESQLHPVKQGGRRKNFLAPLFL